MARDVISGLQRDDADVRALRKCRSALAVCGAATIVFAIWSIVKIQLARMIVPDMVNQDVVEASMSVGMVIELAIYVYVGLGARSLARGNARRPGLTVLAWYLAIEAVLVTILSALAFFIIENLGVSVADLIIEASSGLAPLGVAIACVREKRLSRKTSDAVAFGMEGRRLTWR